MKGQRDISEDIVQFVLDCVVRVPLIIGHHVINQVSAALNVITLYLP